MSAINLQDDGIMVLALPTRRLAKPPEKSCMSVVLACLLSVL